MLFFSIKEMAVQYAIAYLVTEGYSIKHACDLYSQTREQFDAFLEILKKEPGYESFVLDVNMSMALDDEEDCYEGGISESYLESLAESFEKEVSGWKYYEHKIREINRWKKARGIDDLEQSEREKIRLDGSLNAYRDEAIKAAKELLYDLSDPEIFDKIRNATNQEQISRIMANARKGVNDYGDKA